MIDDMQWPLGLSGRTAQKLYKGYKRTEGARTIFIFTFSYVAQRGVVRFFAQRGWYASAYMILLLWNSVKRITWFLRENDGDYDVQRWFFIFCCLLDKRKLTF